MTHDPILNFGYICVKRARTAQSVVSGLLTLSFIFVSSCNNSEQVHESEVNTVRSKNGQVFSFVDFSNNETGWGNDIRLMECKNLSTLNSLREDPARFENLRDSCKNLISDTYFVREDIEKLGEDLKIREKQEKAILGTAGAAGGVAIGGTSAMLVATVIGTAFACPLSGGIACAALPFILMGGLGGGVIIGTTAGLSAADNLNGEVENITNEMDSPLEDSKLMKNVDYNALKSQMIIELSPISRKLN